MFLAARIFNIETMPKPFNDQHIYLKVGGTCKQFIKKNIYLFQFQLLC